MNLKNIQIELEITDIERIMAIALDDNAQEALVFIRENLSKKVQKALQGH